MTTSDVVEVFGEGSSVAATAIMKLEKAIEDVRTKRKEPRPQQMRVRSLNPVSAVAYHHVLAVRG
jgi:hypothetical protein